jgi:hypothetical protein
MDFEQDKLRREQNEKKDYYKRSCT